jgi:hypothetical protein
MNKKLVLSKSEYMMYLKHPAYLWIKKHDKNKIPPVGADLQAMFDAGNEFEQYAESLFPDGVRVGFNDYNEYLNMPSRTQEELDRGTKTIFQGRFEHDQTTFICDVLKVTGKNEVDLYEIKSSTGVKLEHILDLAYQTTVLENSGYIVNDIYVVHVDNSYVRNGDVDPKKITNTTNVTEEVKKELSRTRRNIVDAIKVMEQAEMPDPSPARCKLNSLNEWLEVYKNIKPIEEGSIYELCRLNANTVRLLEEEGVNKLKDIPLSLIDNEKQRWQLDALEKGEPIYNKDKIKKFLSKLQYPLYFFDYETLSSCVPYFDGTKPYQQIPFQYSLHVIEAPGGELKHMGYLQADNTNPAEALSKTLKEQIGDSGSIIAWNMSFEKMCNTALGTMVPEYKNFYEALNSRMADLMIPFSNGYYIDYKFGGSASIKNVLPVLVPELSYKELGIQEGGSAQRSWMDSVLYEKRSDKDQVLKDLEEYCKLDTLAMVEIFNFLTRLVAGEGGSVAKAEQLGLGI